MTRSFLPPFGAQDPVGYSNTFCPIQGVQSTPTFLWQLDKAFADKFLNIPRCRIDVNGNQIFFYNKPSRKTETRAQFCGSFFVTSRFDFLRFINLWYSNSVFKNWERCQI
jgi:hypothetical protein